MRDGRSSSRTSMDGVVGTVLVRRLGRRVLVAVVVVAEDG